MVWVRRQLTIATAATALGRFASAANDKFVTGFILLPGLGTEGGLTPGGHRNAATDGGATFTTTVGVIDGVHDATANLGATTQPAGASGFTQGDVARVDVPHLSDGGVTLAANHPHFPTEV